MPLASSFDSLLFTPEFFADPYPLFQRLRAEAPVWWSEKLGGWVLTRYDDVVNALRDVKSFSSAGRVTHLLRQLPAEVRRQVAQLERHYEVGLAHSDPPSHTRIRSLLTKVFTPRMVETIRPRIQAVTNELLDKALGKGEPCAHPNTIDAMSALAYPLPATIIAAMIGAPAQDHEQFKAWAAAINGLYEKGGRISAERVLRAQHKLSEMRAYLADLIAQRRAHLADDLLSGLVGAEREGAKLNEAELVSTAVTLFVAGHETTTHLIGNGLVALLRHPDQWQKLKDHPELMPQAIEEMLRYDTSVPRSWRIATADIELGGQTICKGQLVLPLLAAANRDPAQFPDPDRFEIERQPNKHLGFGHGVHFCLGAPLARLEAPIAIGTLLRRAPNLRLAVDATKLAWRHDIALRGLEALPLEIGDLDPISNI
jgi:cytochrome P450